jgi:hypothetical protein
MTGPINIFISNLKLNIFHRGLLRIKWLVIENWRYERNKTINATPVI